MEAVLLRLGSSWGFLLRKAGKVANGFWGHVRKVRLEMANLRLDVLFGFFYSKLSWALSKLKVGPMVSRRELRRPARLL